MTSTIQKKAIDPGFGGIKIAWLDETNQIKTLVVPSVVALGRVSDLSAMGLGKNRKHARPLTVNLSPDLTYLVGENVHLHGEPIEDLSFLRLSEGLINQALMYAALGSTVNGHPTTADLMLGFPVEIMKDKAQAQTALRNLRAALTGQHKFALDGRPINLTINQVRAVAQPVGAYFDWGLDTAGEWVRETDALKKPIAVCDIGFNTVDLFSVEQGEIVDRYTDGNTLGMHRVARAIQRHVREKHGVSWGLHQADALLRQHLEGRPAAFYCADGEIDLTPQVLQSLAQTAAAIGEFIASRWGNGRQFYRIILTGGGAAALRDSLLRSYPTAHLPHDPVTSNASGLLKWANRIFK